MGIVPFISGIIPAAANLSKGFPAPDSQIYQAILVVVGVVALSYSIRGEGKKSSPKDLKKMLQQ